MQSMKSLARFILITKKFKQVEKKNANLREKGSCAPTSRSFDAKGKFVR